MSYRCQVCSAVSPPGTPKSVHTVSRIIKEEDRNGDVFERKEIVKEIAVCKKCLGLLEDGVPLTQLKKSYVHPQQREAAAVEVVLQPSRIIPMAHKPVFLGRRVSER